MPSFRSTVLFAALGAGLVLAGFFLVGPTVEPPAQIQTPSVPETSTSSVPETSTSPRSSDNVEAPAPRSVQTIPFNRPVDDPSPATTGGPPQEPVPPTAAPAARDSQAAAPSGAVDDALACNTNACSRKYRSFDRASCTYQPHGGGPRQRCEK